MKENLEGFAFSTSGRRNFKNRASRVEPSAPTDLRNHPYSKKPDFSGLFWSIWSGREDLNLRPLGPEPSPEVLGFLGIDAISGRG